MFDVGFVYPTVAGAVVTVVAVVAVVAVVDVLRELFLRANKLESVNVNLKDSIPDMIDDDLVHSDISLSELE